ncbi:hypothetical protein [Lentzea sp. NPDC060358]|uniref:hypothetical protein n=1 Tax=Lentzea sp. NPDC060358 TaxID=3347103 RepID=UPI00364D0D4E
MHTRWRWVLFGLGAAVAACGPLAMAGGPWYGYVFGGLWFLLGGTVAWRCLGMGTRLTTQGITSNSLDRQTTVEWCDVREVVLTRRRNLIAFHTIAPVVRHDGGKEVLTELSRLSIKKDTVPERAEKHVAELRQALGEHRAGCSVCGAQPKAVTAARGLGARVRSRLRSLLRGNGDRSIVR